MFDNGKDQEIKGFKATSLDKKLIGDFIRDVNGAKRTYEKRKNRNKLKVEVNFV